MLLLLILVFAVIHTAQSSRHQPSAPVVPVQRTTSASMPRTTTTVTTTTSTSSTTSTTTTTTSETSSSPTESAAEIVPRRRRPRPPRRRRRRRRRFRIHTSPPRRPTPGRTDRAVDEILMAMSSATVVTIFHPTNDSPAFVDWVDDLRASAPNATDLQVSVVGEPHLDWVWRRGSRRAALHQWLDSAARQRVLEDGRQRGILCATADLVTGDDGGVPQGVGMFGTPWCRAGSRVRGGGAQLAEASSRFSGFEGCCTFTPAAGGDSLSVLRFRTERQLATWLGSPERIEALGALRRSLSREFSLVSSTWRSAPRCAPRTGAPRSRRSGRPPC